MTMLSGRIDGVRIGRTAGDIAVSFPVRSNFLNLFPVFRQPEIVDSRWYDALRSCPPDADVLDPVPHPVWESFSWKKETISATDSPSLKQRRFL
ncbi:MAG: hypothetical protein AB2L22_10230 [Syntrophales bacterium]